MSDETNLTTEARLVDAVERLADEMYKIRWYLGALASQGQTQLRIMAKDREMPCFWHDPSVQPWGAITSPPRHGQPATLTDLKIGVPPEMRNEPPFDV